MVTLKPIILAPAGTVVTAIVCEAPAGLLSGMLTEIVPEETGIVTGGGGAVNCVFRSTGVPAQTAGDAGEITGVGGFGLTLIDVVYESFPVSGSLLAGLVDVVAVIL